MSDNFIENEGGPVRNGEVVQKEKTKKPSAPLKMENGFEPVFISIGQGGFNLASKLRSTFGKGSLIAINTSEQDLSMTGLDNQFRVKIGGVNANGAGKDREKGKKYLKDYSATIKGTDQTVDFLTMFTTMYEEVLFGLEQKLIFVVFSSSGGTGSSIGPMFTTLLTNYVNSKQTFILGNKEYQVGNDASVAPRPIVTGVTMLADINEGVVSLQNSIECGFDLQRSIDGKLGSYIILDNTLAPNVKCDTIQEKYEIINSRFASAMLKFFGLNLNSNLKCVDLQDKINSLRIPGVHTFISLEKENNDNLFQCVVPYNQTVPRLVTILTTENPDEEKLLASRLRDFDITVDDSIIGFFDPGSFELNVDMVSRSLIDSSIIGLFGISSISKIVEDLRSRLHSVTKSNSQKNDTVKASATGFTTLANDKSVLQEKYAPATANVESQSIMDMFE